MLGFLIAVVAGAATPFLETPVARPFARTMAERIDITDTELRLIAFMVAMMGAGVLCALFDTGSGFGLAVGGSLGYFGLRLLRALQHVIDAKRD